MSNHPAHSILTFTTVRRINAIDQARADEYSKRRPLHLLHWHKNEEETLWFENGMQGHIEILRELQSHRWTNCNWSDDEESLDGDDISIGERGAGYWARYRTG